MELKYLNYHEFRNKPNEWEIKNLTFGLINLVVGRNAVGKTRMINVLSGLAKLLSHKGKIEYKEGNYQAIFQDKSETVNYTLQYEDNAIVEEILKIGNQELLIRGKDGSGEIYFEDEEKHLRFQTPVDEIAAFARRDSIQHPFLKRLTCWGENLVTFRFGKTMGQESLMLSEDKDAIKDINIKETERVVKVFVAGLNRFGKQFKEQILLDMNTVGYDLEAIGVDTPEGITVKSNVPIVITQPIMGIYVKEDDLGGLTYQTQMSQGMFRTLSLIIQLNYFLLNNIQGSILIDDIGEGLDFERSSALIKVLINKTENSNIQLIMTTNDRYTMNNVPIEYWLIFNREGSKCYCYNYRNSKEIFDEFELTGLSNFDLFSTNYYLKGDHGNK